MVRMVRFSYFFKKLTIDICTLRLTILLYSMIIYRDAKNVVVSAAINIMNIQN